jgi:hypothetical protein
MWGNEAGISLAGSRGCGCPQLSQFATGVAYFQLLPSLLEEFSVVVGQHCHSNIIEIAHTS